jgi:hypothetical protein
MNLRVSAAASAAALLLIAPGVALAKTAVVSVSLPTTNGATFALGAFDTSLGTLTGVTLSFDESILLDITVLNLGAPGAPFGEASTSTTSTVSGPGGILTNSFSEDMKTGGTLPLSGQNVFATPFSASASTSLSGAALTQFESSGPGTLSYTFGIGPFTSGGSPDTPPVHGIPTEFFGGDASVTGGTLSVTYDYTGAVPEPADWALMILGFGGVGAMLRRRRTALA